MKSRRQQTAAKEIVGSGRACEGPPGTFFKRPEFTVEQGGVTATIYREIFMAVRGDAKTSQTDLNSNRTVTEQKNSDSYESSEKSSVKSSEKTRDKIVREMRNNPNVTIHELAMMLAISDRAISKHLKILQEQVIIRRVGADRGGYWEIINHSL